VTLLTSSEDTTVYSTGQFSPHHSNSVSNHTTKQLVLFYPFLTHIYPLVTWKN